MFYVDFATSLAHYVGIIFLPLNLRFQNFESWFYKKNVWAKSMYGLLEKSSNSSFSIICINYKTFAYQGKDNWWTDVNVSFESDTRQISELSWLAVTQWVEYYTLTLQTITCPHARISLQSQQLGTCRVLAMWLSKERLQNIAAWIIESITKLFILKCNLDNFSLNHCNSSNASNTIMFALFFMFITALCTSLIMTCYHDTVWDPRDLFNIYF